MHRKKTIYWPGIQGLVFHRTLYADWQNMRKETPSPHSNDLMSMSLSRFSI